MARQLAEVRGSGSNSPSTAGEVHRALLSAIVERSDRDAFRSLFDHFAPRIKSTMIASGAASAVAEDLVQDVMITVWAKAHLYAPDRGSVSTWIFAIARNARIDRLRRGTSRPYDDLDTIDLPADDPDGEAQLLSDDRDDHVASAIAQLPTDQKHIIELAFLHDLTQSEISRKLELPLGTVKSRMRLAYKKLRSKLEHLK